MFQEEVQASDTDKARGRKREREGFNGEERGREGGGRDGATGMNKQEDECFQLQCFIDDTPQACPCINHTSALSLSLSLALWSWHGAPV